MDQDSDLPRQQFNWQMLTEPNNEVIAFNFYLFLIPPLWRQMQFIHLSNVKASFISHYNFFTQGR